MYNIIRIFVGAPTDVNSEREIIKKVIDMMNKVYKGTEYPQFELIKVGTDVRSDFGSGLEAQDVIDSQIDEAYDLFIGILWKKFGSQTRDFDSGTQQEFENALKSKASVMFYFSNLPVSPDDIIPEQLAKIRDFKNEIKDEGLYFEYSTLDEFEELITNNLRIFAIENKNKESNNGNKTEDDKNDEKSMFDLIDITLNNFKEVANDAKQLSKSFEKLDDDFNQIKPPNENDLQSYKIYSNSVADILNEVSINFKDKKRDVIKHYSEGIDGFIELLEHFGNYMDDDTRENLKETINSNIDVLTDFNKQMNEVIEIYNQIPPLTNKLIRSKSKFIKNIKDLLKDLKNLRSLLYKSLVELDDSKKAYL